MCYDRNGVPQVYWGGLNCGRYRLLIEKHASQWYSLRSLEGDYVTATRWDHRG